MCLWDNGVQDKVLITLPSDIWFYDIIYCNEFLQYVLFVVQSYYIFFMLFL